MGFLDGLLNLAKGGYNTFVKPTVDTFEQLPSNLYHIGNAVGMMGNSMLKQQQGAQLAQTKQNILDEMNKTWFAPVMPDKHQFDANGNYTGDKSLGAATNDLRRIGGITGEKALNVAAVLPGVKTADVILQGGKVGLKQLIQQGAKTGMTEGAKYGAGYGATDALQQKDMSAGDLVKKTATGAATGAAVGGTLGAAGAGVIHGPSSLIQSMLDKQGTNLRNLYMIHAMQHLPADMPAAQPSVQPRKIPVMTADQAVKQPVVTSEGHDIPKLEAQIANHPNATPHELTASQSFKQAAGLNEQQYHQFLTNRLDDLNKGGISTLATAKPVERPTPSKGADGAVTPAKAMSALDYHTANAQDLIAHQHNNPPHLDQNSVNMNNLLKEKQAQNSHAQMPQASGLFAGKLDQLKARQAAYKTQEAGLKDAELAARDANAPSPAELKVMNSNAVTPVEKPIPIKVENPKVTGSAHENQGGMVGQETATTQANGRPKVQMVKNDKPTAEPAIAHRTKDENGNVTSLINTKTGETFSPSYDGSPASNFKNELLHEESGAYGKNGSEVAAVHRGGESALKFRVQELINHVNNTFSPEERTQLTYYAEGSLKASEVSPKVKQIGDQWKELERIGYLLNKEANPKAGEVDNAHISHVEHINLDKQTQKGKVGLGKFSTKNSTQQGRNNIKLTGVKGKTQFGDPLAMGMTKMGNGTFTDKFGNTWHPSQPTIKELKDHGFNYESDAAKIMASSFNKYAKTANNLKLGRNLLNENHGKNIIQRMQGELKAPKGYHESHIHGLQNSWMKNGYHSHLYTASDSPHGLVYKGVQLGGNLMKLPTAAINQTFFAENSLYHQLVNEMGQSLTTMGAGTGKGSKLLAPFKGLVDAAKTSKLLGSANTSVQTHDEAWYDYVRAGGHTSEHSSGGLDRNIQGVWQKLKAAGHTINLPGRFGQYAARHISDTIRVAKFKELTEQGMGHREAAALINRVQGDYGNLNEFEKNIVTNYAQFYPFYKHQVTSLITTGVGAFKNPAMYAGAATTAALTYAAYVAFDKSMQALSGNKYFHVTKGGMFGLVDDVAKAKSQMTGYKDASGKQHPGTVPSLVTKRLNPVEKIGVEQSTGTDLATNTKFDTSASGRVAQASKVITPVAQGQDISSGRRSIGEKIANMNGMYFPHGAHTPAAPNAVGTPVNGLINVEGMNAKATLDAANAAKAEGGSKLAAMQYARNAGDNSLQTFWDKNPALDPKNSKFEGYAAPSAPTVAGKNLIKSQGGSSLAYMQAMQASGNKTYAKFFKENPTLDPTSPQYQPKPSSRQQAAARYAKSEAKYALKGAKIAASKAKSTMAKTIHDGGAAKVPGMHHAKSLISPLKPTKVKLATIRQPSLPKSAIPKSVKLKLKA